MSHTKYWIDVALALVIVMRRSYGTAAILAAASPVVIVALVGLMVALDPLLPVLS